ncbi:hypothetical protein N7532_008716 [Penicillium argentinense]|uniref:Uncharacterized protein n=1 Tax=Penicillium argentinense TaxID=1131581 RepID=A0A9W9K2S9_9EURO|nr:uncharacterized protein N7532_008716 [Penicillium argentinense]KAJ5090032.1 hypothetical protein N7532_008716 [Penicillium argentinense]
MTKIKRFMKLSRAVRARDHGYSESGNISDYLLASPVSRFELPQSQNEGYNPGFSCPFVGVGSRNSDGDLYKGFCRPPGHEKTFEDGYEVAYSCDVAGNYDNLIDISETTTPDDCAKLLIGSVFMRRDTADDDKDDGKDETDGDFAAEKAIEGEM